MKRQLNKQEMALSVKNLKALKDKLEYNEYQVEICKLKLEKGLQIDYLKQMRDYKQLKHEFVGEVAMSKINIKVLQDQIRNGVEIKEIKKEDNKDE